MRTWQAALLCDSPTSVEHLAAPLPAGVPKEVVPEAHQQRNLLNGINFFFSLAGGISANITAAAIQGQIPSVPTLVPGVAPPALP